MSHIRHISFLIIKMSSDSNEILGSMKKLRSKDVINHAGHNKVQILLLPY